MQSAPTMRQYRPKPKDTRPSASKRGYGARWRRYRKYFLTIHPLCVICKKQNMITSATVVDHIIPHKGDMKLFWDKTNHQGLCKCHHDTKTAREDGGFGHNVKIKE